MNHIRTSRQPRLPGHHIDFPPRSPRPRKKVAVIGAGASGLISIKELKEHGHDVVAFEAANDLGGVYQNHYGALRLTSSSLVTKFGCYSDGQEARPVMWDRGQYLAYLGAFAERFGLYDNISFRTAVTRIERHDCNGTWMVHWRAVDGGDREGCEEVNSIAICSGVHTAPRIPNLPGLDSFDGVVQHSSTFTGEEDLDGERVLIVGLGESGSDIALLTARRASRVAISTRNGPGYVVPRLVNGLPSDLDTNRCYHSFPAVTYRHPLLRVKRLLDNLYVGAGDDRKVLNKVTEINGDRGHSFMQRFGTKNTSFIEAILYHGAVSKPSISEISGRSVLFSDGSVFKADRIIFCTGYQARFPFLDDDHSLAQGGRDSRTMFKRMVRPDVGADVAWIGLIRPGFGSIPPMAEMQARYFAMLVSGLRRLPSAKAMRRDIELHHDLDMKQYPDDAVTIRALTDYLRFMDSVATEIGCRPTLSKLLFFEPMIWFKTLFAPISGVQYRLNGPGADELQARAALKRTPTRPIPIILYEFAVFAVLSIGRTVGMLTGR